MPALTQNLLVLVKKVLEYWNRCSLLRSKTFLIFSGVRNTSGYHQLIGSRNITKKSFEKLQFWFPAPSLLT